MANSVTVGLGLAVLGYGGRYVARFSSVHNVFPKDFLSQDCPTVGDKT